MTDVAPVTPPAGPATTEGQVPTPATPPAPAGDGPPPPASGTPAAPESTPSNLTPEALQAELARARNEAAAERQRRKAAEDEATALKNEKLTDQQRVEQERDQLKDQTKTLAAKVVEAKVEAKAATIGLVDPALAATLIAGKVETDADGNPTNIDTLLEQLLTEKPYLAGTPGTPPPPPPAASPANPASPPRGTATGLTKAQLQGMTPTQIAALDQAEVDRVLATP